MSCVFKPPTVERKKYCRRKERPNQYTVSGVWNYCKERQHGKQGDAAANALVFQGYYQSKQQYPGEQYYADDFPVVVKMLRFISEDMPEDHKGQK